MSTTTSRWNEAWWDALAFAIGLGLAWFLRWETTDLVWSLWLSSLVVGYATIVWTITRGLREFATRATADKTPGRTAGKAVVGGALLFGALFMLAFFTVHFGGFHFGHSVFLNSFFPVQGDGSSSGGWPGWETYTEIVQRYWVFLPAAFIAERAGFRSTPAVKDDGAVTAEAIAARKARQTFGDGSGLMAPYKNVMRMHLLIFFFAGAHVAKADNFLVYAVVYAVYFFPWRLLQRPKGPGAAKPA
ncbi:MAG TPA: DUF6498-containing protein [Opitutaceae bacterium]|nr:DUF6498-containing protein [Opitutaceae bacterium]